jgi:predicted peptidase
MRCAASLSAALLISITAPPRGGEAAAITVLAALSPAAKAGQHRYTSTVRVAAENLPSRTVRVNYLLYLPDAYGKTAQRTWPLILFLHGRGERGEDLELLLKHPLPKTLERQRDFPFIVVSPQLPAEMHSWSAMIEPMRGLLDQIEAEYSVDPLRVSLTGISMGGAGAWEFALRHPKRFSALAPIAGYYEYGSRGIPENICDLRDIPIWVFHGEIDTTVESFQSEVLADALKRCGGNVRFTLYPDAEHADTWNRAYEDPALFEWLLNQTRGGSQK